MDGLDGLLICGCGGGENGGKNLWLVIMAGT